MSKTITRPARYVHHTKYSAFVLSGHTFPAHERIEIYNPHLEDIAVGDRVIYTFFRCNNQNSVVEEINGNKIVVIIYKGGSLQRRITIDLERISCTWCAEDLMRARR